MTDGLDIIGTAFPKEEKSGNAKIRG